MLTVAIASENDDYDGEVYRVLLERLLGIEVAKWQTEMRFNGCRSVWKLATPYLSRAAQEGIRHALIAVDNDGGARTRPEHHPSHPAVDDTPDEDGCRVCWLEAALPRFWTEQGRQRCVVVPVQTLETWLLFLRGDVLRPSPEQDYDRRTLKRRFFPKPEPPVRTRIALALTEVRRPEAIIRLRERPSFRHFEAQLVGWRSAAP